MVLGLLRPSSFGLTWFGLRRVSREREFGYVDDSTFRDTFRPIFIIVTLFL